MSSRAVVEKPTARWNNHDREGYIACVAENCKYNMPRRPCEGRDAVAAWWDFSAAAFGERHLRVEALIESGNTVVLEAVAENKHTRPLRPTRQAEQVRAAPVAQDGVATSHDPRCFCRTGQMGGLTQTSGEILGETVSR